MCIWFGHLKTDWIARRHPQLRDQPIVLAAPEHGRMMIRAANAIAESNGIHSGMVVADSRAILPALQVLDDDEGLAARLLQAIALWCLRYTPVVAVALPDRLTLDITGCAHLWGGEGPYLKDIITRLRIFGYDARAAIADTIGAACAVARYGRHKPLIEPGRQLEAILPLPVAALRLDTTILDRMYRLGLHQVQSIINIPRTALYRRFGQPLLLRLDQALGQATEAIEPVRPPQSYQERLPSLEPIRTALGIEIALRRLLEALCRRLQCESKGLRSARLQCFRIDGKVQQIAIGTNRPSRAIEHLLRLFALKIGHLEPDLGFELFLLEAPVVESLSEEQELLWQMDNGKSDIELAELIDRLSGKLGKHCIRRYLPQEHYWPERSIRCAEWLQEQPATEWRIDRRRPVHLLPTPEPIEVTVPLPDYPPVTIIYRSVIYRIAKADGPERIEREWWLEAGELRDYYCLEDEEGVRYWVFRSGQYNNGGKPQWFIHGFFA